MASNSNKPCESPLGISVVSASQQQQPAQASTATLSQAVGHVSSMAQNIDAYQCQNPAQTYSQQQLSYPMLPHSNKPFSDTSNIQGQFSATANKRRAAESDESNGENSDNLPPRPKKLANNSDTSIGASEEFERGGSNEQVSTSSGDLSTNSAITNESAGSGSGSGSDAANVDQRVLVLGNMAMAPQMNNPSNTGTQVHGYTVYHSTPVNASKASTHVRGTETIREVPFMPGSSQHNSGLSIGYSPFIGGVHPQMPQMNMASNMPYAPFSFGESNLQQSVYPAFTMPYVIPQQQSWLYGGSQQPFLSTPQSALQWHGRQNITGSSFDSGIMGNISGAGRSNASNLQAIDDTQLKNISTDESVSGTSTESSAEKTKKTSGNKGIIQEVQRKFKPFIRRQIETDAQTNVQRARDVDLECEIFRDGIREEDGILGRFSSLGYNRKYSISLAEIYRRIKLPENLNTSALCVIMRLAKSKDGGKSFRTKLQNAGLSVQSGRRKSVPATIFSILCEGEVLRLVDDFAYLTNHYFPCKIVSLAMNRKALPIEIRTRENVSLRLNSIQMTKNMLAEFTQLIEDAIQEETQPLSDEQDIIKQASPLETGLRDELIRYGRITHCFGNRALAIANRMFMSALESCEAELRDSYSASAAGNANSAGLGLRLAASTSSFNTPQMLANRSAMMNSKPF